MLNIVSIFAIISLRKKEVVDLLCLSFSCIVVVSILYLFLRIQCGGLQCVIGVFPDHTQLSFSKLLVKPGFEPKVLPYNSVASHLCVTKLE